MRITDVRLCVGCIAALTSVSSRRVAAMLERAQATVRLREERAVCGRCARSLTVYGLGLRKPSLSV